ncbi:MAG: hypothetical protein ACFBSD_05730 [Paracoccaceae bacterium]
MPTLSRCVGVALAGLAAGPALALDGVWDASVRACRDPASHTRLIAEGPTLSFADATCEIAKRTPLPVGEAWDATVSCTGSFSGTRRMLLLLGKDRTLVLYREPGLPTLYVRCR